VDKGRANFEQTYLMYLTDSPGELMVDGVSYPIRKGCGYTFSEGLSHQTVGTGSEPRLLLGPMSEAGIPVGGPSIAGDGATDTVYIRFNPVENRNEYQINNNSWQVLFLAVAVVNTNPDPGNNVLKLIFTTDITLTFQNEYFICASDGIQFGSTSLNSDGTRPRINIEDVNEYPGLIQNPSRSNIYVYNLEVRSTGVGNTYLTDDAGWIGQAGYGIQAYNNYIVNCFSDGDIPENGGGIVGRLAGRGDEVTSSTSSLYIIGCSSHGTIGPGGGGIVGEFAGSGGGYVKCENCWQEFGQIGTNAGGIFGNEAANGDVIGGEAVALKCYSRGQISGTNAGGIFGQLAGTNATTIAEKCYSQGAIGVTAGGIYGGSAGSDGGTSTANNCYSTDPETSGNGIFFGGITSGRIAINCYAANGNWSNNTANSALNGVPNPIVGTTWIATGDDSPYELNDMGYTPYTLENIVVVGGVAALQQSYTQTISAGGSTIPAIRPGYSYDILQITGGDPASYGTITCNSSTGVISTTGSITPGNYNIFIRNTGSYNITIFGIAIGGGGGISVETASIPPCCQPICPQFNQTTNNTQEQLTVKLAATAIASDVDSTYLAINQNRAVNFVLPTFNSYRDYMTYLQSKYR
jgi:hypothetical protein